MPNIELARQIRDYTREHPDQLDMGCIWWLHQPGGLVVGCFAGWTVKLATDHEILYGGTVRGGGHVGSIAQELLGLTSSEAHQLFYDTSNDELDATLEEIFGVKV